MVIEDAGGFIVVVVVGIGHNDGFDQVIADLEGNAVSLVPTTQTVEGRLQHVVAFRIKCRDDGTARGGYANLRLIALPKRGLPRRLDTQVYLNTRGAAVRTTIYIGKTTGEDEYKK